MGLAAGPARFSGTAADGTAAGASSPLTPTMLQNGKRRKFLLVIQAAFANTGKVHVSLHPGEASKPAAEVLAQAAIVLAAGQNLTVELFAGGDVLPLACLAGSAASQAYTAEIWEVAFED